MSSINQSSPSTNSEGSSSFYFLEKNEIESLFFINRSRRQSMRQLMNSTRINKNSVIRSIAIPILLPEGIQEMMMSFLTDFEMHQLKVSKEMVIRVNNVDNKTTRTNLLLVQLIRDKLDLYIPINPQSGWEQRKKLKIESNVKQLVLTNRFDRIDSKKIVKSFYNIQWHYLYTIGAEEYLFKNRIPPGISSLCALENAFNHVKSKLKIELEGLEEKHGKPSRYIAREEYYNVTGKYDTIYINHMREVREQYPDIERIQQKLERL